MRNPQFEAACERLKTALKLPSDSALARELGFSVPAFQKRRERGSTPLDEIADCAKRHGLSLGWVHTGEGAMYESDLLPQEDYHRLRIQLEAMQLHNAALDLVRPVLAGVLTGDKAAVERAVDKALEMTPDEANVLRAYRRATPDVKAAMTTLSQLVDAAISARGAAGESRQRGSSITIRGNVGQQVAGDQHVNAPMTITTGGKRK